MSANDYDLSQIDFSSSTDWLKSADLGDDGEEGVAVTIVGVSVGSNDRDDGSKVPVPIIHIKEFVNDKDNPKKLSLNKTNREAIIKLLGAKTLAWVGKKIKLFTVQTQTPDGTPTMGLRVRSKLPPQSGASNGSDAAQPILGQGAARVLCAKLEAAGLTVDDMREWLTYCEVEPGALVAGKPDFWPVAWGPNIKEKLENPKLKPKTGGVIKGLIDEDSVPF